MPNWSPVSTLVSVATLPLRVAAASTRTTLALGVLVAPEGPLRRPGGYAPDRPLGKLAGRLPLARRRAVVNGG